MKSTLEILNLFTISGNVALAPQLILEYTTEYLPIKKLLSENGGEWNPQKKGFVFKTNPKSIIESIINNLKSMETTKENGLFNSQNLERNNSPVEKVSDYLATTDETQSKMNFFSELANVIGNAEFIFTAKKKENKLTLAILPKGEISNIKPLIISGTPEDLDQGFFLNFGQTLHEASSLVSNVNEFKSSLINTEVKTDDKSEKAEPKPKRKSKAKTEEVNKAGINEGDNTSNEINQSSDPSVEELEELERKQAEELAEKKRKQAEEEEKQQKEIMENYERLISEANEFEANEEFLSAAKSLKAAKEFALSDHGLDIRIKQLVNQHTTKQLEEI